MKTINFNDYLRKIARAPGELFVSTINDRRYLKQIDGAAIVLTIVKDKLIVEPNKYSNMERAEIPLKNLEHGGSVKITFPQQFVLDI